MSSTVSALSVVILAAIALVVSGVIAAVGHPVPDQLWNIDLVLVGGATGISVPALTAAKPVTADTVTYTAPPK